jgi:hypothetical protein
LVNSKSFERLNEFAQGNSDTSPGYTQATSNLSGTENCQMKIFRPTILQHNQQAFSGNQGFTDVNFNQNGLSTGPSNLLFG